MGVVTVADIDYGQIFGPFPSRITATDPAYIIGMLTQDRPAETAALKVNTEELRDGPGCLDWLPYVSIARDEAEQNMEAYLKEGGVYYRTLRIVRAGEELLVWYSKDFTHLLGVPELATNSKRDDEQYICPHCGEMFDFPFPLRAHLKFKCAFAADIKAYLSCQTSTKTDTFDQRQAYFNGKSLNFAMESNKCINNINNNNNDSSVFSLPAKRHLEEADDRASPAKLVRGPIKEKPRKAGSLNYSIEELSKSSVTHSCKTERNENGNDVCSETGSAFRKVEKSSEKPERHTSPCDERMNSPYPGCAMSVDDRSSPSLSNERLQTPSSISSPLYNSIGALTLPVVHNPMVQGSPPPSPRQLIRQSPSSSMPPPPRPPLKATMPFPSSQPNSTHFDDPISSRGPSIMGLYMPAVPMFPPPAMLGIPRTNMLSPAGSSSSSSPSSPPGPGTRGIPVQHSGFPAADQIPPGLLEMCRATIPTVGPLTESFAANIRNSETLAKQALFADRHISSLGFLKSSNPMVEKLLQSTNPTLLSSPINALNLSQNWCAKCNATFRMTSDLVYHMRSHHKREFDPMKRKREEKLKCNICNEAFRERHHLTRHMSSHA